MGEVVNMNQESDFPRWLNQELWEEYKLHRKDLKRPLTPRAEKMAINRLARLIDKGSDQEEIIEQTIANGWIGLWEVKS